MTALLDMSKLPAPNLVWALDVGAILTDMKRSFNEMQPTLLLADGAPAIRAATMMETAQGDRYWQIPVGVEAGLYYLEHESEPLVKLLEQAAYRELLLRQRVNEAAKALMVAYAAGADLDNMAADFGVVRLAGEADDRLRSRRQLALESFSTAGAVGSYEYQALTADVRVLDVFIDRPEFSRLPSENAAIIALGCHYDARLTNPIPGDVAVTVLVASGADAAAVKAAVAVALDTETVVPLTDNPHLLDADIISYAVVATLYCYPGPSAEPIIAAANVALQAYADRHYRLGYDIAVSGLHQAAHQPGVQRVVLNIPADIVVMPYQAAYCTSIQVILGGRDV